MTIVPVPIRTHIIVNLPPHKEELFGIAYSISNWKGIAPMNRFDREDKIILTTLDDGIDLWVAEDAVVMPSSIQATFQYEGHTYDIGYISFYATDCLIDIYTVVERRIDCGY